MPLAAPGHSEEPAVDDQDLTPTVLDLLKRFHDDTLADGEVAFQAPLRRLAFDYTPAAIGRIDDWLARFRSTTRLDAADFLAQPSNRGFLRLLACLVGEATARYLGLQARWLDADQLAARLAETAIQSPPPAGFGLSLGCELPGIGLMLPLAAVTAALLSPEPPRLLDTADLLLGRDLKSERLRDPGSLPKVSAILAADPAFALGQSIGSLITLMLGSARAGENPVAPLLLSEHRGARRTIHSLLDQDLAAVIEIGRERMSAPDDDGHVCQLLAHDGYARLPAMRCDALWAEGVAWAAESRDCPGAARTALRARMAFPYRPAGSRDGGAAGSETPAFAVLDPLLVGFDGDAPAARRLRAGLYLQLKDTAQPGGALWPAHRLDEPEVPDARMDHGGASGDASGNGAVEPDIEAALDLSTCDLSSIVGLPSVPNPFKFEGLSLSDAVECIAPLLREGKPVWGAIVQANLALFDFGASDLPAAVVYSPDGHCPLDALRRVAAALMALRRSGTGGLSPDLRALVAILDAEDEHVFGRPVPVALSALADVPAAHLASVCLSVLWVVRDHLPAGSLRSMAVPLLVSGDRPGHVAIVPSRAWPKPLLAHWGEREAQRHADRIDEAWRSLQQHGCYTPPSDDRPPEAVRNEAGLARYARDGLTQEALQGLAWLYDNTFAAGTRPPPMDWEWSIDMELRARGECRLEQAEAGRARGKPFDFGLARQAFAARATAHLIALHRQALVPTRGPLASQHRVDADELQFAALGLLIGCPDQAELMARLLLKQWPQPGFYTEYVRPEVWAVIRLLADHLRLAPDSLSVPPADPRRDFIGQAPGARPALFALLANAAWRGELATVTALFEAACAEHLRCAPIGPFLTLPLPVLLMLDFRRQAGLPAPVLDSPLLQLPFNRPMDIRFPPDVNAALDAMADEPTVAVRGRMRRSGYSDQRIAAAILGNHAPKTMTALARPRPALR